MQLEYGDTRLRRRFVTLAHCLPLPLPLPLRQSTTHQLTLASTVAGRFPHIPAGLGRRMLRQCSSGMRSPPLQMLRASPAPFVLLWHRPTWADQVRSRPAPRRPARPHVHTQAASNVRRSLIIGHEGFPTCQVRANATKRVRRRVPTMASGALRPLRARGKAPSGQVSRSQEVYGC